MNNEQRKITEQTKTLGDIDKDFGKLKQVRRAVLLISQNRARVEPHVFVLARCRRWPITSRSSRNSLRISLPARITGFMQEFPAALASTQELAYSQFVVFFFFFFF
jgi:hypothetical protein